MMDDEQNNTQEEADGAHSDVGDAQEGVLSSHPGNGAQDHSLTSIEAEHRVIWLQVVKGEFLDWESVHMTTGLVNTPQQY